MDMQEYQRVAARLNILESVRHCGPTFIEDAAVTIAWVEKEGPDRVRERLRCLVAANSTVVGWPIDRGPIDIYARAEAFLRLVTTESLDAPLAAPS